PLHGALRSDATPPHGTSTSGPARSCRRRCFRFVAAPMCQRYACGTMRMKPRKKILTFKDEDAEREFWTKADSTEYIDWSKAKRLMLPNFRRRLGSTRLPE